MRTSDALARALALLEGELTLLDCETTGLYPSDGDRVVSVAVLPGRLADTPDGERFTWCPDAPRHWHCNPGRPSHPRAAAVHGLSDGYLATCPPLPISDVTDALTGTLVAHNVSFDVSFLEAELDHASYVAAFVLPRDRVCTCDLSRLLWPGKSASLDSLASRLGVARIERAAGTHDALGDCHLLARCLPGLVAELRARLA